MVNTKKGGVEASMARDTFGMGTEANWDAQGNINPNFLDPLFPSIVMDMPDLSTILEKLMRTTANLVFFIRI